VAIRIFLMNVAHFHFRTGLRHELHDADLCDADRTYGTLGMLVEARFLVTHSHRAVLPISAMNIGGIACWEVEIAP